MGVQRGRTRRQEIPRQGKQSCVASGQHGSRPVRSREKLTKYQLYVDGNSIHNFDSPVSPDFRKHGLSAKLRGGFIRHRPGYNELFFSRLTLARQVFPMALHHDRRTR